MIKIISFWMMPVYMGLYCVAEPLFHLWLGPGWQSTIEIFKVLVFLGIFIGLGNPIGTLILSRGKPGLSLLINLYVIGVNLMALKIGAQWGMLGVAWSVLLAMMCFLFPANYIILKTLIQVSAKEFTQAWFPSFCLAGAMAGFVVVIQKTVPLTNAYLKLGVSISAGVMAYLVLVFVFQRKYLNQVTQMVRLKSR